MSATRPGGWRTASARRRRPSPEEVQAKTYAAILRRRLTANAEAVLRAVFGPCRQQAASLKGTPASSAASALRSWLTLEIEDASRRLGVPHDSLGFEVDADRAGRVQLRYLMPENADQEHLSAVLRELAAKA